MLSVDGWDLSFPDYRWGKTPEKKNSISKTDATGIEAGPARSQAMMLRLDQSGGLKPLSLYSLLSLVTFSL